MTGFPREAVVDAGKRVPWFPHPSGENGEYVKFAKRSPSPTQVAFVDEQYMIYVEKRRKNHKPMKKFESEYKRKTGTVWAGVEQLHKSFECVAPVLTD